MKEANLKISAALFVCLILDLARPFGYSLCVEFLFLGIIFSVLNCSFGVSLVLAAVFGMLKDIYSVDSISFNFFESILLVIVINYILRNFTKRIIKFFIFFGALFVHIIVNNLYINRINLGFSVLFFIHSTVIFLLIRYLLYSWLKITPLENDKIYAR